MESLFDQLMSNPVVLAVVIVLAILLLFSLVRRLLKLTVVMVLLLVIYFGYLVWSGQEVPTTPEDLSNGVMDGWSKLGVQATELDRFVHGTTATTNTLIERTGAKPAHITTMGM